MLQRMLEDLQARDDTHAVVAKGQVHLFRVQDLNGLFTAGGLEDFDVQVQPLEVEAADHTHGADIVDYKHPQRHRAPLRLPV